MPFADYLLAEAVGDVWPSVVDDVAAERAEDARARKSIADADMLRIALQQTERTQ